MNNCFLQISDHLNKHKKIYYTIIGLATISTMGIYFGRKLNINLPKISNINYG